MRGLLAVLVPIIASGAAHAQDLEGIGQRDAVVISGGISAQSVFYGRDGIAARRSPFSYTLNGAVTADLYDLSLPFSFTVGEQERGFSQPFNQFGVSPRYKWITGHIGYRNLTFSPYTLAGHQILGAGVELSPGDFRMGFIAGRFNRAVEEDTLRPGVVPAYERNGFAGRIGYGSEANHLDLIVVKAQDDPGSLRAGPTLSDVRPAENLVLGAGGRVSIIDGLSIHADFAVSDYTRDVRSEELTLSKEVSALGDLIAPRTSTQVYMALSGGLSYSLGAFALQAGYSRIDPDYQSMGAYYLGGDIESFNVAPSVALFENELTLNASVISTSDNIQGKKTATTNRLIPSLNIGWSPSAAFGITLQAGDMITAQRAGNRPLNDTTRMRQRSPSLAIGPRYSIDDSIISHSFYGGVNVAALVDDNPFTANYTEYTSAGADLAYTLSMPRSGLTLNASVGSNRLANSGGTASSTGFSVSGMKSLMEEMLALNGALGLSLQDASTVYNVGAGAALKAGKHHRMNLAFALSSASARDQQSQSFTEYTITASYGYNF